MVSLLCVSVCLACSSCVGEEGPSASWPGWRGPTRDSAWPGMPEKMPAVKLMWKKPMAGTCSAGVIAADGFVVAADNDKKNDYYRCYKVPSGEEAWTYTVANGRKMDYGASPRATPAIHAGRVFCIGAFGDVHCLALKTGKVVWRKHLKRDFGAGETPTWGYSTAPVVVDGRLIIHPRDVMALEPATGEVVWKGKAHGPNYSSFAVGTFSGVKQLIGYDGRSLAAWSPRTGQRLWELEVDNSKGYIVPTPVVLGERLLLSTDDEDTRLYAFDKKGKLIPTPIADNEDFAAEMATPTVQGELLLGICEGLICLDPKAKLKTLWIAEDIDAFYGLGHIVAASDRAIVFGEDGTMVLVRADRKKCTILGKVKLCGQTWSHPAPVGRRIYIRDEKFLYGYELSGEGLSGRPGR